MKIKTDIVNGKDRLVLKFETAGEAMMVISAFYEGTIDAEVLKRMGLGAFPDPAAGTLNIGRLDAPPADGASN